MHNHYLLDFKSDKLRTLFTFSLLEQPGFKMCLLFLLSNQRVIIRLIVSISNRVYMYIVCIQNYVYTYTKTIIYVWWWYNISSVSSNVVECYICAPSYSYLFKTYNFDTTYTSKVWTESWLSVFSNGVPCTRARRLIIDHLLNIYMLSDLIRSKAVEENIYCRAKSLSKYCFVAENGREFLMKIFSTKLCAVAEFFLVHKALLFFISF